MRPSSLTEPLWTMDGPAGLSWRNQCPSSLRRLDPDNSASMLLARSFSSTASGLRIVTASAPNRRATAKGARRKPQTEIPLARATTSSSRRDRLNRLRRAANRKAKGSTASSRNGTRNNASFSPSSAVKPSSSLKRRSTST
jgi:hypothetical protein